MDFSLSSSLVGSAVSNPDKLALDLQFAADKSLTARKGPTPVFTRASSGTFVGSDGLIQSAGNNIARFDHDPVTLACKGLLIEESRTNLILQSETIGTTWTVGNATILSDSIASPSGLVNADKIVENTAVLSTHGIDQSFALTVIAHTFSFYAKKGERIWIRAFLGGLPSTWFNLNTGLLGTVGAGVTAAISDAGNGWWKCSLTGLPLSGQTLQGVRLSTADNILTYTGDGTSGAYVWGAQLEAGSFATSYIPTTTASVIRSADVCSISGSDFSGFYNPLEGSLFTSVIFNAPTSSVTGQLVVDINDTTTTNRLRYFRNPTTGISGFANTSGSTTNVSFAGAVLQPFVMQKFSAGFKLNDYAFYANNSQVGVDNLGALLVSPTTLTIGDASAGAARQYTNGTISSIRYYKKRLPNAKLQAITV